VDDYFWHKIAGLVVLMLISAFFSSSETAYFSLKEKRVKELAAEGGRRKKRLSALLKEPRKLLITILTGNTIINVTIASLSTLIALDIAIEKGFDKNITVLGEVIIVTLLVLIFSEVSPKLAAVRHSEAIAKLFAYPLTFVHIILQPISRILYGLTNFVIKIFGIEKSRISFGEEEMKTLVDVGEEQGTLEKEEHKMLHGIMELSDTMVREIMVPRTDVTMMHEDTTIKEAIDVMRKNRYSRIPVFGESVDDIEGILYTRDLIQYLTKSPEGRVVSEQIRPAYYVPETKMVDDLLRDFQEQRKKFALVVDEYGGLAGLVTLEDILEEIVGEIQDEHDNEKPIFRRISNNRIKADARWDLDDVEEEIGISFPSGEGYDSLGGFLFHQFGEIPAEDQETVYSGVKFKVLSVQSNRIMEVEIDSTNKEIEAADD